MSDGEKTGGGCEAHPQQQCCSPGLPPTGMTCSFGGGGGGWGSHLFFVASQCFRSGMEIETPKGSIKLLRKSSDDQ